jgi:hypothetical protein
MQTVTLNMGSWLRRLVVRNSLVRASDRIEATAIFVGLASAVLVVPFAGALGTAIYDNRVHAFTAERLAVHEVEATATQDSSVTRLPYQSSVLTPLQWQFAGHTHTNIVSTPGDMEVGERTSIWVDAAGDRVERLPSDLDAALEAVMAAFGLWVAVAGGGAAGWALLRPRLNRMRYAAWDRELDDLADNGGRTNRNA